MRDLPFISLLLHLSLHLGDHLLHPSQLGNTEPKKKHVRETCDLHHDRSYWDFRSESRPVRPLNQICYSGHAASLAQKHKRNKNLNKKSIM